MATLVTGGAGYVGSHTVVALHAAGHRPVLLDNFSNSHRDVLDALRSLTTPELAVIEGDAADLTTVEQAFNEHAIDAIVHFAAQKSVPESVEMPLRYYRNNLDSTLSLAEMATERGVTRFVFSSSAVVYGTSPSLPVTEESTATPQTPYGATKLMCERILEDTAASGDMQAVILRYFNPVGAHPSGRLGEQPIAAAQNLVPIVMKVAQGNQAELLIFGDDYDTRDGTAVRDFIHVMDLARGHVAALEADLGERTSRIFNLGTGVGTTVLELVAAAGTATGRSIPYEISARRPGDIPASWADSSRAADELGWYARHNLAEMLADQWRFTCEVGSNPR